MRRAVIDIGTNTVKLLVAEVTSGRVVPVLATDAATRLGEGLTGAGRLAETAIQRTVAAVGEFVRTARELGATEIVALTTSAGREAANRGDFFAAVRRKCGVAVQAISGEQEAELIFCGVASDPAWSNEPLLVMDVGGGSIELVAGRAEHIERRVSLPLGAVRLTEQFAPGDFPALFGYLRQQFYGALAEFHAHGRRLIGTGGSVIALAAIRQAGSVPGAPPRGLRRVAQSAWELDHAGLSVDEIRALVAHLNALTLEQRRHVPGLPPERADIIVAGGTAFLAALEVLGATELTVSLRSLRFGALVAPEILSRGK